MPNKTHLVVLLGSNCIDLTTRNKKSPVHYIVFSYIIRMCNHPLILSFDIFKLLSSAHISPFTHICKLDIVPSALAIKNVDIYVPFTNIITTLQCGEVYRAPDQHIGEIVYLLGVLNQHMGTQWSHGLGLWPLFP